MHYFKLNIGDWISHTHHLSAPEELAFFKMLLWQYLHEKPLPDDVDMIGRHIGMRSDNESITFVLRSFFELGDDGYYNKRAFKEIEEFKAKSDKARASVNARWNKKSNKKQPVTKAKKDDTNVKRSQSEGNTKHKPKTINQIVKPDGVTDEVWSDFLAHRKRQKADLSETALKRIVNEAAKAGWSLDDAMSECVARGWRSFKAEWVNKVETQQKGMTWE